MFCPNCGKQIENGALFCPECGERLAQSAPAVQYVIEKNGSPLEPFSPNGILVKGILGLVMAGVSSFLATPVYALLLRPTASAGTAGIVLSVFAIAFAIAGIVLSSLAVKSSGEFYAAAGNRTWGKAKAGRILGKIGRALSIVNLVSWIIILISFIAILGLYSDSVYSSPYYPYR